MMFDPLLLVPITFIAFCVINCAFNIYFFRRVLREEIPENVYAALESYDIEMSKLIEEQEESNPN